MLIHDGARQMITPEIIKNVMNEVAIKKAISVMTKTVDTIKEVDENGKIIRTIDRSKLYNTQTPQAFETSLIKMCMKNSKDKPTPMMPAWLKQWELKCIWLMGITRT